MIKRPAVGAGGPSDRPGGSPKPPPFQVGQEVEGPVAEVRTYGVLLKLEGNTYLLHRNQMAEIENRRADPLTDFQEGQQVKVSPTVEGARGFAASG